RRAATTGISTAPGTETTSSRSAGTPWRAKAATAPSSRRCVTSSLKRLTTRAKSWSPPCRAPLSSFIPSGLPSRQDHVENDVFDAADDLVDGALLGEAD